MKNSNSVIWENKSKHIYVQNFAIINYFGEKDKSNVKSNEFSKIITYS